MKKLLFCVIFTAVALLSQAQNTVATSVPEVDNVPEALLNPDFAYPADVKKTVEAFLAQAPADDPARLLAVTEWAKADRSIDSKRINQTVAKVLYMADVASDASLRAMLYCYASSLCRSCATNRAYAYNRSYSADPAKWNNEEFDQAADSLSVLAYHTAPADAPLKPYLDALDASQYALQLMPTVRDFVLLRAQSGDALNDVVKDLPQTLPIKMYLDAKSITYDEKRLKKYVLDRLSVPGSAYAFWVYYARYGSSITIDCADRYDVLSQASRAYANTWIARYIDKTIEKMSQSKWNLKVNNADLYPGDTLSFKLYSSCTDYFTCELLRYDNYKDAEKVVDKNLTETRADEIRTLVFEPKSGYSATTTFVKIPAKAGAYVVRITSHDNPKSSKMVTGPIVRPWLGAIVRNNDGNFIQLLNSATGEPCKGLKVSYQGLTKNNLFTDSKGMVKLPLTDDYEQINITDSKTGLVLPVNISTLSDKIDVGFDDDEDGSLSIVTDRPVYRAGEEVSWTATLTRNKKTAQGDKIKLSVTYPNSNKTTADTTFVSNATDRFGRTSGSFRIPTKADIGTAYIFASCNDNEVSEAYAYFEISDFKLPDLRFDSINTVVRGKTANISGRVVNSAGTGLSDIALTFSAAYTDSIVERCTTGNDGRFSITLRRYFSNKLSTDTIQYPIGQYIKTYNNTQLITISAQSPDGKNAEENVRYNRFYDYDLDVDINKYVDMRNGIKATVKVKELNGIPYTGKVSWAIVPEDDTDKALLRGESEPGDIVLTPEQLDDIKAGQYFFMVMTQNEPASLNMQTFTAYNTTKTDLPNNDTPLWFAPQPEFDPATGLCNITVGARYDNTIIWYALPGKKNSLNTQIVSTKLPKGFSTLQITIPDSLRIASQVPYDVWTVRNGIRQVEELSIINAQKSDTELGLKLTCEHFRDRMVPGASEKIRFMTTLDGKPVAAAVFANIYNRELLKFGRINLPDNSYRSVPTWYEVGPRYFYQSPYLHIGQYVPALNFSLPDFSVNWKYDIGYNRILMRRTLKSDRIDLEAIPEAALDGMENEETADAGLNDYAVTAYGTAAKSSTDDSDNTLWDTPLRTTMTYTAAWAPLLTTDATTGAVDLDFVVPNQNSTWDIRAKAWTEDMQSAHFAGQIVAVKPVIVAPNPPRFVRVSDRVNIVSAITNNTDSTSRITYSVQVGDGRPVVADMTLDAGATRYVNVPADIDGTTALADTLYVTIRAANGTYGDGERVAVPILPSTALVTDSYNFYVNPDESCYSVPSQSMPDHSEAETHLDYTANPMWVVVKSLPSVIDEPCFEVAPAYAMRLYIAKTALKIVRDHPVAASVIDIEKASKAAKEAIDRLKELKTADGGFRQGKWQSQASLATTLSVLSWLDQDTDDPDIKQLLKGTPEYMDNNVLPHDSKPYSWPMFALVRSAYGEPTTLGAQQVVDYTVNLLRKDWKNLDTDDKALAASTLWRTGNKQQAKAIINSLNQFGEMTPDRGMVFPNMPGITSYANLLEAYGTVDPQSPQTDAVRQFLISQRRGASWGKTAWTAYAVRAMVSTGTDWTVPAGNFTITVDGNTLQPDSTAALFGAVSVPVTGRNIVIQRTAGTPSYGALVTRYVAPLTDIAAFSDGNLAVTKDLYITDDNGKRVRMTEKDLTPGQKITVSLTVTAKTDMTDLIINDLRPAAFEPVQQLGKYNMSAARLWYYIANRDSQTNIYLDVLPRGTYTFDYDVTINNTGTFTTGMTTIISTIDPDLTAHSASSPLIVPDK